MDNKQVVKKIKAFYDSKKWHYDRDGNPNIFYLEGIDTLLDPVENDLDGWNDARVLWYWNEVTDTYALYAWRATTEPGLLATNSKQAAALEGVARIPFGQFRVWQMGTHKNSDHPALVQRKALSVYADNNKDGKREGDKMRAASGINQHGTSIAYNGNKVGNYSAGCLVAWNWVEHLIFMELVSHHTELLHNPKYYFYTAIADGKEFAAFQMPEEAEQEQPTPTTPDPLPDVQVPQWDSTQTEIPAFDPHFRPGATKIDTVKQEATESESIQEASKGWCGLISPLIAAAFWSMAYGFYLVLK